MSAPTPQPRPITAEVRVYDTNGAPPTLILPAGSVAMIVVEPVGEARQHHDGIYLEPCADGSFGVHVPYYSDGSELDENFEPPASAGESIRGAAPVAPRFDDGYARIRRLFLDIKSKEDDDGCWSGGDVTQLVNEMFADCGFDVDAPAEAQPTAPDPCPGRLGPLASHFTADEIDTLIATAAEVYCGNAVDDETLSELQKNAAERARTVLSALHDE